MRHSPVSILADIAHQFSSTHDWERRVEESLRILRGALPPGTMALGLDARGWKNFCCPEPENRDDLDMTLLLHYSFLTGEAEPTASTQVVTDRQGRKSIRDSETGSGSFVSVPVTAADRNLGVLHARSDGADAYLPEHLSVMRAAAAQIGGYVLGVLAGPMEEDRQRLASELCHRVSELQTILDSAPVAMWIAHDPECRRITGNVYADRILRAPRGSNISRSAPPGEAAVSYRGFRDGVELKPEEFPAQVAIATGRPLIDEKLDLLLPDGRWLNLVAGAVPTFDDRGRVQGAIVTGVNVTSLRQAEEALRRVQADLNRAQAVAHTGSWRWDVRRNELLWSDETYRMFGVPKGAPLTYETLLAAIHPEDRDYVDQQWQAAIRGEPYNVEHRIVVECNVKWVRERAELEFDKQGQLLGAFGTVQDVTDLMVTREALREAYDRERHISDVLQQSLLPEMALDLPNHEIFATYHPALKEAEVGGDFYDVFDLADDWKALVLGDVSGKGLRAAVYTSMAKYIIRAYAHEDPEPKSVLKRLNEALAEFMPDETFITVFYCLLDTRRNILVYANAGHEPPVVYSSGSNTATTLDVTGLAVGMLPSAGYSQRTLAVFPGNILLVYTDGISDSRFGANFFEAKGVSETLVKCAREDAAAIAETIYQAALDFSEGCLTDDAAVLVVKAKAPVAAELDMEYMRDDKNAEYEVQSAE